MIHLIKLKYQPIGQSRFDLGAYQNRSSIPLTVAPSAYRSAAADASQLLYTPTNQYGVFPGVSTTPATYRPAADPRGIYSAGTTDEFFAGSPYVGGISGWNPGVIPIGSAPMPPIIASPPYIPPVNVINGPSQNMMSTANSGKTFSRFTMDDVIQQQTELVTGGVWSSNVASLTTHFSSSAQTTTQRTYYVDVHNTIPGDSDSLVQFSIAYGHALGSGSNSQGQLSDSPSKAIYSQFKQLLLNTTETRFTTQGSGSTDSIYAITFKRNRMKERLDPGNFEVPITAVTSRPVNATGSVVISTTITSTIIDDSSINTSPVVGAMGRVYNLVSGSISTGVFTAATPVYFGKAYPDYGVLIIDGNVLDQKLAFKTNLSSSSEANNHFALFRSISGSGTITNAVTSDKFGFLARNSEKITSAHYFVRVRNNEFNFTNNPSYVTGSQGDIKESSFKKDPVTYITTVGLYNDNFELLAVAKVSKPIQKTFSRESLIRVKLDF